MTLNQKVFDFEINLTKMKWCPKHVTEVPEVISRAFERDIPRKALEPIIGTDHVKEWILKKDEDIPEFYNAPTMMQEWIAEKVIKVRIPDGLMPKGFQPKKSKILVKGEKIAKFFGEDNVSTRTVENNLKLFDCGHFYMKQTLPGTGASPHWTIFEGTWTPTQRGLRLEYLLRYSWQLSRKPYMDFNIEATRSDLITTLAWEGESEKQLNGNLPAIVGTDDFFWAELVRMGECTGTAALRWNEDCPEPPSWSRRSPPEERPRPQPAAEKPAEKQPEPVKEEKPQPKAQPVPAPRSFEPRSFEPRSFEPRPELRERKPAAAAAAPEATKPAPSSAGSAAAPAAAPTAAPPPAAGTKETPLLDEEDTESPTPLYIGLGIFVLIASAVLYFNLTAEERD